MINWKPEGRKKRGRPRRTWKDGLYTAMSGRELIMGEWNYRRQFSICQEASIIIVCTHLAAGEVVPVLH